MIQQRHCKRWMRKTVNVRQLSQEDEIHDATGAVIGFKHAVAEGTYPKCGLDHPLLGIGDYVKFDKHVDGKYTVIGIRLERDRAKTGWDWIIDLGGITA